MKKTSKRAVIWFLLFITTVALTGCYKVTTKNISVVEEGQADDIKGESEPELVEGKKLSLSVTYGYEGIVKYGRNLRVNVEVTNNGDDFEGYVRIILPKANKNNVMYEKETSIPAGETKNVILDVPYHTSISKLNVMVVNDEDQKVIAKSINVMVVRGRSIYFWGVLSDNTNQLSYVGNSEIKVFNLTKETLSSDYAGLNTLDIILINDFNTSQLSDKQYDALKEFVSKGGTLVLGTGATGDKVLAKFTDDFIIGSTESLGKKKVVIGKDTLEKTILPTKIEEGDIILTGGDTTLMQKKDIGLGNVQIASFDLALEDKYWKGAGRTIVQTVQDNIGKTKQAEIMDDSRSSELVWRLQESMSTILTNKIPKVAPYALVLLIYVMVVGPILYLILKQKDKRGFTWVLVPVISLVFAIGIYILGGTTRITKPFIAYINFATLDENNKSTNKMFFNITAPSNKSYSFTVDRGYNMEMLGDNESYYAADSNDKINLERYKFGFQYSGDKTVVKVKDLSAFTPVYFSTETQGTYKGTINHNLSFERDKFLGTIENQLGYNLEHALLVVNSNCVILGDIDSGEKVSIDKKKVEQLQDEFLKSTIFGGEPYGRKNLKQKEVTQYFTLEHFLENRDALIENETYIFAFASTENKNDVVKDIGLKSNGIDMVLIPVELNFSQGDIVYVPNIESYGSIKEGNYNNEYLYMESKIIKVEYEFPMSDEIQEIYYGKMENPEFGKEASGGFVGTIEMYNYKTGKFDTIFTGGKYGRLSKMGDYISKKNTMLVQYLADESVFDKSTVDFPILSGVKKEKTNKSVTQ